MKTALYTKSGLIQYGTVSEILAAYNQHGNWYELRGSPGGPCLWHKGHNQLIGEFKAIKK